MTVRIPRCLRTNLDAAWRIAIEFHVVFTFHKSDPDSHHIGGSVGPITYGDAMANTKVTTALAIEVQHQACVPFVKFTDGATPTPFGTFKN
jgi:hypothetical protein